MSRNWEGRLPASAQRVGSEPSHPPGLSCILEGMTSIFKISRDELASMAGMATETVSRTLSDFKDEKLIEKKGSHIQILDINRLIKMKN